MGWFSAKKTTYVSSVVYPLGEDGADRTDMMKYTVLNSVLQQRGIAESIQQNFLRGQGMSLRNGFRYARDSYTDGLPTSQARYSDQPDLASLVSVLADLHKGADIKLITTVVGTADFEWWAERYLAETYGYDRVLQRFEAPPVGTEVDANVAYDLEPTGAIRILLMNADGATKVIDFQPTGYANMGSYIHCAYQTERSFEGGTTTSTRVANPGEDSHTTYSSVAVQRTGETQSTNTKTQVVITGSAAEVTVTDTILVTSRPQYFLYRLGQGTHAALDAALQSDALSSPYFPSVPLRVWNADWTDKAHEATPLYKTSDKLLSKVGLHIKDLGDKINTSGNVKDIDFCFAVFGVQLNTKSPEGKRYLYRYFEYLRSISKFTSANFNDWVSSYEAKFPNGPQSSDLPNSGVTAPAVNSVEIYSEKNRSNNHDVKLQWQSIDTRLVDGQVSPDAKPGTVTISMGGAEMLWPLLNDMVVDGSALVARKQIDANTYEELLITGLVYENFIYRGKSVIVTANDAMTNPDEEGFLVPLNQEIIRATPLVELTNLSYQCMFLVFNCYKVVKQKWYQTGLFKVIVVIIAILVVIFTWGAGTPAAAAMISGALVAAGVGVTLAIVLAATAYVLAMMIISSIIMNLAVDAFGPKWGAVIGAIVSIIAMNYTNTATTLASAAGNSSSLITASNVIQASSALATMYLQDQLTGVSKDMKELTDNYNKGMAKIEDLTKEYLSTSLNMLDVQGLAEASYTMNYEQPNTFLNRTLMTGSDVCAITSGLIENYTEVGLQLPNTG